RLVALGGLRVVADHEPHRPGPTVAIALATGRDAHFLHTQVAGHTLVAPRASQGGGGLTVGVTQFLGVDVVPATAGQVAAVGPGGEATVGDPHHPAQVPVVQIVLDRADNPGSTRSDFI